MIFFPPDPANVSASPRPGKNFPTRPEVSRKIKNVKLIKIGQNQDRVKRKWHTSFFVSHLLYLKLVPIDSDFNSVLENQTYFYQIYGRGTQKSSQT